MKVYIGSVELLLDENNDSDGHHKFSLASDDIHFDILVHQDTNIFAFLIDKYKLCEQFDFGELDALVATGEGEEK